MDDADMGTVDLVGLAQSGTEHGFLWTYRTDDLNLNALAVAAGASIAEHVNHEVDVLLVGVEGEGTVVIDGRSNLLRAGQAIVIPKGTRRSIGGDRGRFVYLSCHRRRAGMWPQQLRREGATLSSDTPEPS